MRLSSEKAMKYFRSGHIVWQVWGHAHQNRFVQPHEERLEVYVRSQVLKGKRRHQEHGRQWGQFGHLLNGSLGGVYFTKKKEAERFAQEILDGHHAQILWDMREDADTFDLLDEELGICDRGMGAYDEHLNYQYDEMEFA